MNCRFYEIGSFDHYRYVVIVARNQGKWLLCRHKDRATWEMPGGHIEEGESALDAARRELDEETGAIEYDIHHVMDMYIDAPAVIYYANVTAFGTTPESEIGEVKTHDQLPSNLTYHEITHEILRSIQNKS